MKLSRRIGYAVTYYIGTALLKTWKIKNINKEAYDKSRKEGRRPVLVLWHDSLLPLSFSHYKDSLATIASDSKDGDLIAYILEKWGYKLARGSSTRGGIKAVMKLVKLCKTHNIAAAITVDGPKGPRHEVKSGAVFIAKCLDNEIYAVTLKTDSFIRFNSWDKFIFPKPFAKVEVWYSDAFYVSEDKDEAALKEDTGRLQKFMMQRTSEVYSEFL
ncbi:MAG: lysophospholipid acyltransferase family protein [Mucispirillum sp.]|nr:lysophospholipid acyltransferase family protein [Mucispirillum sp.]